MEMVLLWSREEKVSELREIFYFFYARSFLFLTLFGIYLPEKQTQANVVWHKGWRWQEHHDQKT